MKANSAEPDCADAQAGLGLRCSVRIWENVGFPTVSRICAETTFDIKQILELIEVELRYL